MDPRRDAVCEVAGGVITVPIEQLELDVARKRVMAALAVLRLERAKLAALIENARQSS